MNNESLGKNVERSGELRDLTQEFFGKEGSESSKEVERDVETEVRIGKKIEGLAGGMGVSSEDEAQAVLTPAGGSENRVIESGGNVYSEMWRDGKLDENDVKMIKEVENRVDNPAVLSEEVEKMSEEYLKTLGMNG